MMRKSIFTFVILLPVIFGSCKETKDPGPDLTSQMEGEFNIDYLVVNKDNGAVIAEAKANSSNGKMKFTKKDNSTLIIQITIKDSKIEVNDRLEASVIEDKDQSDYLVRPGLLKRYRLLSKYSNKKEVSDSGLYLYKNGNVVGSLTYGSEKENRFLSFGI